MRKLALSILLIMICLLSGCITQNEVASQNIKVVVTVVPLKEFTESVGGDKVQVSVFVPPGSEPHTFEPAPSQIKQMAEADLYIMNGAGLEFWMDRIFKVNEEMKLVDTSQGIELIREGPEEIDPHIWLSLRNAQVQVNNIYQGLIELDPVNKEYYARNRDDYLHKLRELDSSLNDTFAGHERKIIIVSHPAWTYFARDYDLLQVPLMEGEKEPGARYLSEVVDLAKKNNITTVFVEPEFSPKTAEVVAREIDAQIVYLDPLADNYLENMRQASQKIADSLS